MSIDNIEIVQVGINELKPSEYNPRKADENECKALRLSIERFGIVDPIIVNCAENRKNIVIGGHFRLRIAKEMGYQKLPVVYINIPDLKKEQELNIRLNKNSGSFNYDLLANFDEEMLRDCNFDSAELDKIFQIDPTPEDDAVPENVPAIVKRGEIYQLGRHFLMCGDATDAKDVALIMGEKKADMIFTDPPYNVDYKGMQNSKQWDGIANDMMPPSDFEAFLIKAFTNYYNFSSQNAACYICHADKSHKEFRNAFEMVGYEWRATVIWVKNSPAFNFAQYKYKHEPIFYCYKRGAVVNWYGDRTQNTIWEAKKETGDHPTIKPVELITKAIENSSPREGLVVDLFCGSGSTLIACEKTNRICYGMEIDCHYADVIIKRFENFTGQKAVRI